MEPTTPPSTTVSRSGSSACQDTTVTKASEWNFCDDWELKMQPSLDYSLKPRAVWLLNNAISIYSGYHPEVAPVYRNHAQKNGLHEELNRIILVYDISASTYLVKETLAQNLVFLFLNLEKDLSSSGAHEYLEGDEDVLLDTLKAFLSSSVPSRRTNFRFLGLPRRAKRDEAQLTSLVRALLELSGGTIDCRQHRFDEEYTPNENAHLYAAIFGITRTNQFGECDLEEMHNMISKSPLFSRKTSRTTISVQDLEEWTMRMMDSLPLGFRKEYLVLNGFGFDQVKKFSVYLAQTSHMIPALSKPENNQSLLLAWSTKFPHRQLEVLSEWASSADGQNLYQQLAEDFEVPQRVEQLALTMVALMNYQQLLPNFSEHSDQPFKGSYLINLDTLVPRDSLGDGGSVLEHMVFALVRVLSSFVDRFESLIAFLATALDRDPPLSCVSDEVLDQYLRRRIGGGLSHKTAIAECIRKLGFVGNEDADWADVTHPKELSLQGLHVQD
ncbi:MAG: hypothetical protein Q9188_002373 [Gyalolechia gomerana]